MPFGGQQPEPDRRTEIRLGDFAGGEQEFSGEA